jgi:hypothetical protein
MRKQMIAKRLSVEFHEQLIIIFIAAKWAYRRTDCEILTCGLQSCELYISPHRYSNPGPLECRLEVISIEPWRSMLTMILMTGQATCLHHEVQVKLLSLYRVKTNINIAPCKKYHALKAYNWYAEKLHVLMTSSLVGVGLSASRSNPFTSHEMVINIP